MFNKSKTDNKHPTQLPYAPPADKTPLADKRRSVLNEGVVIRGDWTSDGIVEFGGSLIGDLSAEVLIIKKTGKLIGNTRANTVTIEGNLDGTVAAIEMMIKSSAHIRADISAEKISVESGANIEGRLRIKPKAL
ncbi:MAG: polymer-forming cytoskeletal protein [Octadecabacter sp.]